MRKRRAVAVLIGGAIIVSLLAGAMPRMIQETMPAQTVSTETPQVSTQAGSAREALDALPVKGRAPKTGYERSQFGDGWAKVNGCSTRDIILNRDLTDIVFDGECSVVAGTLQDPYTATTIMFTKAESAKVQIDHVVALSDAWQKGAQQLTNQQRKQLANDPLELLAVDGQANQQKSDGDAATWLPKNKAFRCEYVARQIAVKRKYKLWVALAEKEAIVSVLATCPHQALP
jgi:hypothetical protein